MRSRMARMYARTSALVVSAVFGTFSIGAPAYATSEGNSLAAPGGPIEALSTPVGLAAVGFGISGMVAGVLRRKKVTVQPENQRK